jgi:hypothetical protein
MNESAYPGANHNAAEMAALARTLRTTRLLEFPTDDAVAEELTRLGWTSRTGTTLIKVHIGRLRAKYDPPVQNDEDAEDEAQDRREFEKWKLNRLPHPQVAWRREGEVRRGGGGACAC